MNFIPKRHFNSRCKSSWTFSSVTAQDFRAAVGTEFLSPYPSHTHGDPHTHGRVQGCRGDGISIPIPTGYPYPWRSPWGSPNPRQSWCDVTAGAGTARWQLTRGGRWEPPSQADIASMWLRLTSYFARSPSAPPTYL